jgi:hypothetical protein
LDHADNNPPSKSAFRDSASAPGASMKRPHVSQDNGSKVRKMRLEIYKKKVAEGRPLNMES